MKTLQTLIILVILSVSTNAKPIVKPSISETKNSFTHHGLGVTASMISSPFGISYQHNFNERNRVEFSGFIYYDETDNDKITENDTELMYNYSLEYHYLLVERYQAKLYYMIGGGAYYYNEKYYDYYDTFDYSWSEDTNSFSVGTGVAISYEFGSLSWDIDLGILYRKRIENSTGYGSEEKNTNINITWGVGTGLYFNF